MMRRDPKTCDAHLGRYFEHGRSGPNTAYCVGVDLGLTHDRAVVVAHGELDPKLGKDAPTRVVVDQLKVWTPEPGKPVQLQEVEDHIALTARLYRARVRIDVWQAAGMTQRLQRQLGRVQGITPTATTAAQSAANLTHPDQNPSPHHP